MDRGQIMSENERNEMLDWIYENIDSFNQLSSARLDKAFDEYSEDVHPLFYIIKERIIRRELLRRYKQEPTFKDFIALILPGGYIHPHRDPNQEDLIHCRFNVILEMPENDKDTFNVYYDGYPIEAKEGHYVLCRSGEQIHWSDTNMSKSPRVTISYGFLLPRVKVDSLWKPFPFLAECWVSGKVASLLYSSIVGEPTPSKA